MNYSNRLSDCLFNERRAQAYILFLSRPLYCKTFKGQMPFISNFFFLVSSIASKDAKGFWGKIYGCKEKWQMEWEFRKKNSNMLWEERKVIERWWEYLEELLKVV